MTAGITTSCRSGDTRYTRLNLLGWALLCPHARYLLWHGSTPIEPWLYPTSEEAKSLHEKLKRAVIEESRKAIGLAGFQVVGLDTEYQHQVSVSMGDSWLCATSKTDIVYTVAGGRDLYTLYIEVATRLHVAKPWQALLRGLALYYERRLPTWIVLVSPEEVRYKSLTSKDQEAVFRALNRSEEGFEPSPNLCSLCELSHYCPYKVI